MMKRFTRISTRIIALLILLLINAGFQKLQAQATFNWAKQANNISPFGRSVSYSIAVDGFGNSYTAGFFFGTVDFDPSSSNSYNLTASNANATSPGNIMMGKVDLIGYSGNDAGDAYICKLDPLGNFVWAKRIGGIRPSSSARAKEIKIDANNDLYIVGVFKDTVDFDPSTSGSYNVHSTYDSWNSIYTTNSFILKLDAAGNFQWVKTWGDNSSLYPNTFDSPYINSIALDNAGDIFLTGHFNNFTDMDPSAGASPIDGMSGSLGDLCIIKLQNGTGNFLWAKACVGPAPINFSGVADGASIAIDKNDNILITGMFGGTIDFDPDTASTSVFYLSSAGPFVSGSQYAGDIFILKLNNSGGFVWAKAIATNPQTTDYGFDITSDGSGNVLIAGYNYSQFATMFPNTYATSNYDFDPDPSAVHNLTSNSSMQAYALKLDTNGIFVWVKNLCDLTTIPARPFFSSGNAICTDKCDNVYITGSFNGTCDFDPGNGTFIMTSTAPLPSNQNFASDQDIFISKLDANGNFAWAGQFGTGTGTDILVDNNYDVFFTGAIGGADNTVNVPPDFNPGAGVYPLVYGIDYTYFASKLTGTTPLPTLVTATPYSICSNSSTTLVASGPYAAFTWSPSVGLSSTFGASVTATPNVTTTYTVSGANGACADTAQITITVTPSPTTTLFPTDTAICFGNSTSITASGASSYFWTPSTGLSSTSGTSVIANPTTTTTYTVIGTSNGCQDTTSQTISVNPIPTVGLTNDLTIIEGASTVLTANGGGTYNWSPTSALSCNTCANPTANPLSSTTYCVEVTNNGCVSSDCVTITVEIQCGELFVPNVFSPNGDGKNDVLDVKFNPDCVTDFNMLIFDRWGEKVFESNDINLSWDGRYKGNALDDATFVYYLKISLLNYDTTVSKKGNVSIVK